MQIDIRKDEVDGLVFGDSTGMDVAKAVTKDQRIGYIPLINLTNADGIVNCRVKVEDIDHLIKALKYAKENWSK